MFFSPARLRVFSRSISSDLEERFTNSAGCPRARGTWKDRSHIWRRKAVESQTRRMREQEQVKKEEEANDLYGEIIEATKKTRLAT